jgi:outer membrane protein assembly factor BamD
MYFLVRAILLFTLATLILSESGAAAIVFQPGKKAKFVAPGEEEISETALELYQTAQTAEKQGNLKRAIHAYKNIVRQHPRDALAAGALYRAGELQEQLHQYLAAADSFRQLVERYPNSPNFDEAIEAQFRIGEIYLNGKKKRIIGIPLGSALDRAVTIFANVVRTAPYGKYTARAQFNIGLAREKQNVPEMAIEAYQAVVDKFPNEPVAADAQYQIGYIWLMAARKGTKDFAATTNAKTAFQDFLLHYPHSEKAAQARANLELLEHKETASSYQVAKFYDKQKYYRAAVLYYNEVIRQQPGSTESNLAKKRIDQLRAKVGEAALQPAISPEAAGKKKGTAHGTRTVKGESAKPGAANNEAPLPAADTDASLPPPASLAPDTTTAPEPLSTLPGTGPSSGTGSTPEASASPAP